MNTYLDNWVHAGNNRGGGWVARALGHRGGEVHLIDPNPENAAGVADLHRQRGRQFRYTEARVEDVREVIDAESLVVLTPDSLSAIRGTVADRRLKGHIEAQGLVHGTSRGARGIPLALQLSMPRGRDDLRDEAIELLTGLNDLVPPASSSVMRSTGAFADGRMERARERVSTKTADNVLAGPRLQDRDEVGDLFFEDVRYPLVVARGRPRNSQLREAASDLGGGRRAALAFMDETGIDFVLVDEMHGRIRLDLHVPLDRPRRVITPPGRAGDGILGLAGLVATAAITPTFTD